MSVGHRANIPIAFVEGALRPLADRSSVGFHDVAVELLGPAPLDIVIFCEELRLAERPRDACRRGGLPPAEPFVPPGGACAEVPPYQMPRGRLPDAPSPSGVATSP